MKRLFIGVPISGEAAARQILDWQYEPTLNINRLAWTRPANWHITLAFLGATPEAAIARLSQLIDQAFDQCPAYTTSLNGVGVFPHQGKPNVLWIGLDNITPLLPYYNRLVNLLHDNNFPIDSKPLKPHLTIARVKSLANREAFYRLLQSHSHTPFDKVNINSVILYESISTPGGVMYKPLYEKRLIGEDVITL